MQRKWLVMAAAALFFCFATAATFTSLGVVLFTMVTELHWSNAAAGVSFSLLGLTCGLSSPLPAIMMKWIGTRWTIVAGGAVLTAAFALAAVSQHQWQFFIATGLMGIGFTLSANVPGIYLIATWFPANSARMIGFYFMAGAAGGIFGPPVVEAVVELSGSWRANWLVMSLTAALISGFSAFAIRDVIRVEKVGDVIQARATRGVQAVGETGWTSRQAVLTRQFLIIALAMLVIQTGVTTVHSVLVTHLAKLGATRAFGAFAMSLVAFTGTLTKGAAGALSEHLSPRLLLLAGAALQCLALLCLGFADTHLIAYAFAIVFGAGWGASWLSCHVLLLKYFGTSAAAGVVSTATVITTAATLGPLFAGMMADATGSFTPVFYVFAALLAAIVLGVSLMQPPPQRAGTLQPLPPDEAQVSMTEAARHA